MSKRIQVEAGDSYGRLAIISEVQSHVTPGGTTMRRVLCRCSCGTTLSVRLRNLRSGNTTSCGCARGTHGMSRTPTYKAWEGMIQRCVNPRHRHYQHYGGRGISVCQRWKDSFQAFLEDMGERPDGLTLERINNGTGYRKENCRWVTQATQNRNTRRNRLLTHDGVTMCLTDWASRLGIHPTALRARLRHGWSVEDAVTTPSLGRGQRRRRPDLQ